jgi:hypothetical protein
MAAATLLLTASVSFLSPVFEPVPAIARDAGCVEAFALVVTDFTIVRAVSGGGVQPLIKSATTTAKLKGR